AAAHGAGLLFAALAVFAWRLGAEASADTAGRGRERRAAAGVIAALLLLPAVSARAASMSRQKRELEKLSRELEALREEADRYREEAGRAERDLTESALQQRRLESKMSALRRELDDAEGARRTLGGRLVTLDAARSDAQRLLARELGDYVRRADQLASAGTAGVMEDAVRRGALRAKTAYLGGVGVVHDRTVTEHAAAQRHQATLRRRTETQLTELERTRRSKAKAQEDLEDKTRRVGEAEARIAALEESRRALTSLVRELEKKESRAAQAGYRAEPPIKPRSLPWPVAGKVLSGFGKRRVPELGTWSVHNGVEIAAAVGVPVRPVSPGEVIFSGPFRSYGNVVIINHGGGFYSIYGHLEAPLPAKGARARLDAPVGNAAGQGSVYLELRQAGRALDPLRWLKP
ncbi:MAG: peptidoglycan DD-metalloendopeptidase family protein, partial [Elusimicrobia bacterium]|nr:peptidoglycan DD-metalloendopeptidase family protein [Elusimicrobiota bacterium]